MDAGNSPVVSDRRFVVVAVDQQRVAVAVERVARVFHAVEITPVDAAPAAISGCVDVHGEWLPVVSLRCLLGVPERDLDVSDHMVLLEGPEGRALLVCDAVVGLVEVADGWFSLRRGGGRDAWHVADLESAEGVVPVVAAGHLIGGAEAESLRRRLTERCTDVHRVAAAEAADAP